MKRAGTAIFGFAAALAASVGIGNAATPPAWVQGIFSAPQAGTGNMMISGPGLLTALQVANYDPSVCVPSCTVVLSVPGRGEFLAGRVTDAGAIVGSPLGFSAGDLVAATEVRVIKGALTYRFPKAGPVAAACGVAETQAPPLAGGAASSILPPIVPAPRLWKDGAGTWPIAAATRILVDVTIPDAAPPPPNNITPAYVPMTITSIANTLASDLPALASLVPTKTWPGTPPQVVPLTSDIVPGPGDITLSLRSCNQATQTTVGDQGYSLNIAPGKGVTIRGNTIRGVFSGTRSLLQVLMTNSPTQTGQYASAPGGYMVDYPRFGQRTIMLDVGRLFMSKAFLKDYMRFMSFYKLNTLRLHLNESAWGLNSTFTDIDLSNATNYYTAAFRLQSRNFSNLVTIDRSVAIPGISYDNSGTYSESDWAEMENVAAQYGIEIRPEFDLPGHSQAFINAGIGRELPYASRQPGGVLDLNDPNVVPNLTTLISEFAPWFHSTNIHVGGDEVPSSTTGAQRGAFTQALADLILGRKQPDGSYTGGLRNAEGKPFKYITIWNEWWDRSIPQIYNMRDNLYLETWNSAPAPYFNTGAKFIVDASSTYYVVPRSNNQSSIGSARSLYQNWNLDSRVMGGQVSEWNDRAALGLTPAGIHNALKDMIPALAQTLWSGRAINSSGTTLGYGTVGTNLPRLNYGPGVTQLTGSLTQP